MKTLISCTQGNVRFRVDRLQLWEYTLRVHHLCSSMVGLRPGGRTGLPRYAPFTNREIAGDVHDCIILRPVFFLKTFLVEFHITSHPLCCASGRGVTNGFPPVLYMDNSYSRLHVDPMLNSTQSISQSINLFGAHIGLKFGRAGCVIIFILNLIQASRLWLLKWTPSI